jgi:hypothetical protein
VETFVYVKRPERNDVPNRTSENNKHRDTASVAATVTGVAVAPVLTPMVFWPLVAGGMHLAALPCLMLTQLAACLMSHISLDGDGKGEWAARPRFDFSNAARGASDHHPSERKGHRRNEDTGWK